MYLPYHEYVFRDRISSGRAPGSETPGPFPVNRGIVKRSGPRARGNESVGRQNPLKNPGPFGANQAVEIDQVRGPARSGVEKKTKKTFKAAFMNCVRISNSMKPTMNRGARKGEHRLVRRTNLSRQ